MTNSAILQVYLVTFLGCAGLTVGLILLINKGLKRFFKVICQDPVISKFFFKLTNIILLIAGLGAGLKNDYKTGKDSNWLTLTWDSANQLQEVFSRLLTIMMIFAVLYILIQILVRKLDK